MHIKFWSEGKISRRRWDDNIRIDLRLLGLEGVDWIHLPQNMDQRRDLVNKVMNIRFR